jgi:hypothetical protein
MPRLDHPDQAPSRSTSGAATCTREHGRALLHLKFLQCTLRGGDVTGWYRIPRFGEVGRVERGDMQVDGLLQDIRIRRIKGIAGVFLQDP